MEKIFFIRLLFMIMQFSAFFTILLLEVFITFSGDVNRWATAIVVFLLSGLLFMSICFKRLVKLMPMCGRNYQTGILVMVLAVLDLGEKAHEMRSILAYIAFGLGVVFIALTLAMERNRPDLQLNELQQSHIAERPARDHTHESDHIVRTD